MRLVVLSLVVGLGLVACKTDGNDGAKGGENDSDGGADEGGSGGGVKPDLSDLFGRDGGQGGRGSAPPDDEDAGVEADGGDAGPDAAPPDCLPSDEVCNDEDDDCDGDIDEDFAVGEACDGTDDDDCKQGLLACTSDGMDVECNEAASMIAEESCDGLDNDCDDGVDEDFGIGDPCDGTDSDRCLDGTVRCDGTDATTCRDDASSMLDVCNGADDDCDPASGDGSEDPMLGVDCDGSDSDMCDEGTWTCPSSSLVCSDNTAGNAEVCGGGDEDCDDSTDEGFDLDNDPACSSGSSLGSVSGDVGSDVLSARGYGERWFRATVGESDAGPLYLSAKVELLPPPDGDYDLYVYCESCGAAVAVSSSAGTGALDTVYVRAEEDAAVDDTFTIIIEVRYYDAASCSEWQLTVTGNWAADTATCS